MMKTIITFKKSNKDEYVSAYRIYRSDNKDDLYAEQNLVSTLSENIEGEEILYEDTNVAMGVHYYYGLETVSKEGFSIVSSPVFTMAAKNTGAHDLEIILGDREAGYCKHDYTSMNEHAFGFRIDVTSGEFGLSDKTTYYSSVSATNRAYVYGYWKGIPTIYVPSGFFSFMFQATHYGLADANQVFEKITPDINKYLDSKRIYIDGCEYKNRLMSRDEWFKMFFGRQIQALENNNMTNDKAIAGKSIGICASYAYYRYNSVSEERMLFQGEDGRIAFYRNYMTDGSRLDLVEENPTGSNSIPFIIPLVFEPVQY